MKGLFTPLMIDVRITTTMHLEPLEVKVINYQGVIKSNPLSDQEARLYPLQSREIDVVSGASLVLGLKFLL